MRSTLPLFKRYATTRRMRYTLATPIWSCPAARVAYRPQELGRPRREGQREEPRGPRRAASILEFVRPGDTLVVHKLDRLGRNTRDVLNLVHEFDERGACLRVLEPAIDTCGPMGRMVLTVLGMVAEMELGFIRGRQRVGIDAAKARGVCKGRPVTFDRARIVSLRKEGMGASKIAKAVGCKRGNVYKTLKAAGLN